MVKTKITKLKDKQKFYYDRSAKTLPPLKLNEHVRVQIGKIWVPAMVTKIHDKHSYSVVTKNGGIYRRNRQVLTKTKETFPEIKEFDPNIFAEQTCEEPQKPQINIQIPPNTQTTNAPIVTRRSDRIPKANPKYFDNEWVNK